MGLCKKALLNKRLLSPLRTLSSRKNEVLPDCARATSAKNQRADIFRHRSATMTTLPNGRQRDACGRIFFASQGCYADDAVVWGENERLPLYKHQKNLPRLPVPKLEDTLEHFLPTALPLAETPQEAEALKRAVKQFQAQGGDTLQERLLQRKADLAHTSWLGKWWNQQVYLEPDVSNAMNVSYFFRLMTTPSSKRNIDNDDNDAWVIQHGARILHSVAQYAQDIQRGQQSADTVGRRDKTRPLCSSQYKYLFAACRIPRARDDQALESYHIYPPSEPEAGAPPPHAILLCRGNFYTVPLAAIDPSTHRPQWFSPQTLAVALRDCVQHARRNVGSRRVPPLGWLTATDRRQWAKAYRALLSQGKSGAMEQDLATLHSGLFLLALDVDDLDNENSDCDHRDNTVHATTQNTADEAHAAWAGKRLWHGNESQTANRWWDKSMQIVLHKHYLGYIGEHSLADGMPAALGLCRQLAQEWQDHKNESGNNDLDETSPPEEGCHATPLFEKAFDVMSSSGRNEVEQHVAAARSEVTERIQGHDLFVLDYQAYGTERIKKSGYSPDAFVQIAMQLSVPRVFSRAPVATYESTQVRPFLHGRTETTRTVSPESVAFVQAMQQHQQEQQQQPAKQAKKELTDLLHAAVNRHVHSIQRALKAEGVDRHLLGLLLSLQPEDTVPDLFQDPLYLRSKEWIMSTSTLPGTSPGFGPVVPDGVGIGYDLRPDCCIFTITACKEHGHALPMRDAIRQALNDMAMFLEPNDSNSRSSAAKSNL